MLDIIKIALLINGTKSSSGKNQDSVLPLVIVTPALREMMPNAEKKIPQFLMVWYNSWKKSINATVYQDVRDHFVIPYIEIKFGNNKPCSTTYSEIYKGMVQGEKDICSWLTCK